MGEGVGDPPLGVHAASNSPAAMNVEEASTRVRTGRTIRPSSGCRHAPAVWHTGPVGWMRGIVTGAVVAASAVAAVVLVRRASLRWGASEDELRRALPGDELLPRPDLQATRAISIAAAPAEVWPWIAQIGQNRGGFYSYDWLENLVGVEIRTLDRIRPDLRVRAVGDAVNLAPEVALSVAALEEERHLVLRGAVAVNGTGAVDGTGAGAPYDFTWAFVLVPQSDGSTRLVVRERYAYLTRWAAALVEPVEMVSFLMTERMLRGIRDRAERTASSQTSVADSEVG